MADLLVSGIIYGSIIALGAIGLTLLCSILNFFNFAYGDMFSLGAFLTLLFLGLIGDTGSLWGISFGLGFVAAVACSIVCMLGCVLLIDRFFFKPLRQLEVTPLFMSIASLGLAFIIQSVVNIAWGPEVRYYSNAIQISKRLPLGIRIKADEVFIVICALTLVTVVYLFLKKTRMGKAMRAMSDNSVLAKASGVETARVIRWTWVIAGILITVAGTLYGIQVQLSPVMGWHFLIPLFVAVIMGGIGSFWGALIGGLVIGISEEMITGLLQNLVHLLQLEADMSVYKPAVAFVLVVLILLLRPHGIFGRQES
jgi:branched-subunit amino acid ABC-type transport system permease component